MNQQQQTALITGASSGIGLELAREFAGGGFDVILVGRNRRALDQLAAELGQTVRATTFVQDLACLGAGRELQAAVEAAGLRVDILVNNAGFGVYGPFAQSRLADQLDLIAVNLAALTELTRCFLPGMLERHRGRIMNVASTAAFQPGPLMATYYASKAYVLSFSQALREELRGTGVTVTTLCPGTTRTAFQQRARVEGSRLFKRFGAMDARRVARAGFRGTLRGRDLVIPGWSNKWLAQGYRIAPRRLLTIIVKRLQQPA